MTLNPVAVDELMASLAEYKTGDMLTLTAGDFADWAGGTPDSVTFYRDSTGNGDFADATSFATKGAADDWSADFDTSGASGPLVFFATVSDGVYTSQPIELVVEADQAPTIDSVSTAVDSSTGSPLLTLAANGVGDPDGSVAVVNFYTYSATGTYNSSNWIGSDDGTNGWSVSGIDVSGLAGPQEYVAIATDDLGMPSAAVAVTYSPTKLYFDPSGNLAHIDVTTGAGLGGGGSWNWTTTNGGLDWYNPATGNVQAWDNGGDSIAVFAGTAGTLTVSAGVTANSIEFASSYSLAAASGGAITLEGAADIDVASGKAAAIDVPLAGGGNGIKFTGAVAAYIDATVTVPSGTTLTDDCTGTVEIEAAPTFDSGSMLAIEAGTFELSESAGSWVEIPDVSIATGAALSVYSVEVTGSFVESGAAMSGWYQFDGDASFDGGSLSGSGGIQFGGGSTMTVAGTLDLGSTQIWVDGGTFALADAAALTGGTFDGGSSSAGKITIDGTATMTDTVSSCDFELESGELDIAGSYTAGAGAITIDGGAILDVVGESYSNWTALLHVQAGGGWIVSTGSSVYDAADVQLINAGTVEVAGTLYLIAGIDNTGGGILIDSGGALCIAAQLEAGAVENNGTLELDDVGAVSTTLTNNGSLVHYDGTLDLTGTITTGSAGSYSLGGDVTDSAAGTMSNVTVEGGQLALEGGTIAHLSVESGSWFEALGGRLGLRSYDRRRLPAHLWNDHSHRLPFQRSEQCDGLLRWRFDREQRRVGFDGGRSRWLVDRQRRHGLCELRLWQYRHDERRHGLRRSRIQFEFLLCHDRFERRHGSSSGRCRDRVDLRRTASARGLEWRERDGRFRLHADR